MAITFEQIKAMGWKVDASPENLYRERLTNKTCMAHNLMSAIVLLGASSEDIEIWRDNKWTKPTT